MAFTATEVLSLFQSDESALQDIFMDGSDEDIGMDDMEEIENE